jgi:hypothetical protein
LGQYSAVKPHVFPGWNRSRSLPYSSWVLFYANYPTTVNTFEGGILVQAERGVFQMHWEAEVGKVTSKISNGDEELSDDIFKKITTMKCLMMILFEK